MTFWDPAFGCRSRRREADCMPADDERPDELDVVVVVG